MMFFCTTEIRYGVQSGDVWSKPASTIPKLHFCANPILLVKGRTDEAWEPC